MVSDGIADLLVFYYPRNWKLGEIIWTPVKEKISVVENKYLSASLVISGDVKMLSAHLQSEEICMIFLLIEVEADRLMAYQHTKQNNFFTHAGVDKRFGANAIADKIKFNLKDSVGAGDTEMDTFLLDVGLAVHIGNPFLKFKSILPPVKLKGSSELGELFFDLAGFQRSIIK